MDIPPKMYAATFVRNEQAEAGKWVYSLIAKSEHANRSSTFDYSLSSHFSEHAQSREKEDGVEDDLPPPSR